MKEIKLRGDQHEDDIRHQKERNGWFGVFALAGGVGLLILGIYNYTFNNGVDVNNFIDMISFQ